MYTVDASVWVNGLTSGKPATRRVGSSWRNCAEVDRAVLDSETEGFAKIHVKRGTDTNVGATIVARDARDMISLYTTLMTHRLGLEALANAIQIYMTQAEAVRKTADLYNRTSLTPFVKQLMAHWFAGQRQR